MTVTTDKAAELDGQFDAAVVSAFRRWVAEGVHAVPTDDEIRELADRLRHAAGAASDDHCVLCHYKRKMATAAYFEAEPESLAPIEDIIALPQRDGDAGDLTIREDHASQVIVALWRTGYDGLTDEEIHDVTGIYHQSVNGCRAALMGHGWIKSSGRKKLSPRGRPTTVWVLTDRAIDELVDRGARLGGALGGGPQGALL